MSESDFRTLLAGTTFKNRATRVSAQAEAWESDMGEKLHNIIENTLGEQKEGGIRNAYCHIGQSQEYWAEQGRTGQKYTVLPHVDRESQFYTRYMLTFTEDGGSRTFRFNNPAMGVSMCFQQQSGSATVMDEFSSGNSSWRHPSFARDRPHTKTQHMVSAGTAASVTFVFNMWGLAGEPLDPEGGLVMRQLRKTRQRCSLDSKPPKIFGLSDLAFKPGSCKENECKKFTVEQSIRGGKRGGRSRSVKKIEAVRHNVRKGPTHNKDFLPEDKLVDLCVEFCIVSADYNINRRRERVGLVIRKGDPISYGEWLQGSECELLGRQVIPGINKLGKIFTKATWVIIRDRIVLHHRETIKSKPSWPRPN